MIITMLKRKKVILGISALVIFFFLPHVLYAQSTGINISISPLNPHPGDLLNIRVISSETDLNRADITWVINGILAVSGTGETKFATIAGPVGTHYKIEVVVKTQNGKVMRDVAVVRPQEIDFLWRANTYTPPFYKGKALASSASQVVITAMPNMIDTQGNVLDPQKLIYTWSQNGITLGNASGFGRQTIILENGQIPERLLKLQLTVSSQNGILTTTNSITIPLHKPKIVFYEHKPLLGTDYSKALSQEIVDDREIVIKAEPYYFSIDDILRGNMLYQWEINKGPVILEDNAPKNLIAIEKRAGTGLTRINLRIKNNNLPFRILQNTAAGLILKDK